jgi:hypothetical protein
MVYLNLPRVVLWLMLTVLAVMGECPWWLPVGALLYDLDYPITFMLPGMRKRFEAHWEAQRQKQLDAVMGRQIQSPVRKDN